MAVKVKYLLVTRVNDEWRVEGWLTEGQDFQAGGAEARLAAIKKDVESENGPDSFRSFALVDGAREGKEGGVTTSTTDLPIGTVTAIGQ